MVLTFLEIKKNDFYIVETTVDRKSFVTARGWEDLSEMMKLYERHGLTVDQKLTSQYLQNPAVAREFAVYYDLYNKYKSDYQIEDILNGTASGAIRDRARAARFDERLSLLGLLIDAVNMEMRRAVETDNAILENLRVLKQVKAGLAQEEVSYVTVLHRYLDAEKTALRLGQKANSLDYETSYSYHYVIRFLEDSLDSLNRAGVSANGEAFRRIKANYDASTAAHKAGNAKIKARLENLFRFVEEVFADGQEMLILVTEITVRYYCAKFITKFGCDAYFKRNQDLQFYQRKQELLTEIAALDEL